MAKVYTRTFEWRFDQPPEALWPALGDTARFNEAAGIPKHTIEEALQDRWAGALFRPCSQRAARPADPARLGGDTR